MISTCPDGRDREGDPGGINSGSVLFPKLSAPRCWSCWATASSQACCWPSRRPRTPAGSSSRSDGVWRSWSAPARSPITAAASSTRPSRSACGPTPVRLGVRRQGTDLLRRQFVGAFIGATLVWLAYLGALEGRPRTPGSSSQSSRTGPAIRNTVANLHHRDHRHVRAGLRHLRDAGQPRRRQERHRRPVRRPCSWSASACRSVARRDMRSIPRATSGRASCTRSCRLRARATPTGATPGFPSSAR